MGVQKSLAPRKRVIMQLSKQTIGKIKQQEGLILPDTSLLSLPEKVLQFGTGVLLRGLPDYFIDRANRKGIFNGRIVVIKSTSQGETDAFRNQDGLYTLCIRGVEDGRKVEENIVNSAISRVLSAQQEWDLILKCAHDPEMRLIISNTTEVGITLTEDDVYARPPLSFPGKLLAFLLERYKAFDGNSRSGMVIIPTELIPENGKKLLEILLMLAEKNGLEPAFMDWLKTANHFCNSLVDRIVPGKLPAGDQFRTEKALGYKDDLMIMAESFRLWAIETNDNKVKDIISFHEADEGVVIAADIEKFRELKLRLLNGVHTFACGLAHLSGFRTVREAMDDEQFCFYVSQLAMLEIASVLDSRMIRYEEACAFAVKVLDRFRNPSLEHPWLSIAVQFTSKMRMRNVPLIIKHYNRSKTPPDHMALGFAGYLLFMNGEEYRITDDHAEKLKIYWKEYGTAGVTEAVLKDKELWGTDLTGLDGFAQLVDAGLKSLISSGIRTTIESLSLNKTTAG
jgi:tagaturonate reductase